MCSTVLTISARLDELGSKVLVRRSLLMFVWVLACIVLMDSVESTSGIVGLGCDELGVGPCWGLLWWSGQLVVSDWMTRGRWTLLRSHPTSQVASLTDCKALIFFYTHIVLNLNLLGSIPF